MGAMPPYGRVIHDAILSGDLKKMKATVKAAEAHLKETGDVAAALDALKLEIAKLQRYKK